MSDMEDYGFEYSDDDYEEEDVDIENQYYNSKGLLESEEFQEALQGFEQVVKMEEGKGEWCVIFFPVFALRYLVPPLPTAGSGGRLRHG